MPSYQLFWFLQFGTSSKIREIYMGQYQTFVLYISAGNYNYEAIFGKDPFLRTLYLKMAPNPIISQIYFCDVTLRYSIVLSNFDSLMARMSILESLIKTLSSSI